MKILQVHNEYRSHGGENVVVERESVDLRAAGHDVIRYHVTNGANLAQTAVSLAFAPWNPAEARRLMRTIEAERPDVMHIHNTWFRLSPSVISAASKAGLAIVHTLHNSRWLCVNAQMIRDGETCRDCVSMGRMSAVKHRCYRSSAPLSIVAAVTGEVAERRGTWKRDIDRFIVLTPTARDRFSTWGFPRDRIVVNPHRIADPGSRRLSPSASDSVLYVGRLSAPKGIENLCRTWSSRQRAESLVVIGDGPMRRDLEARYPGITFLGQLAFTEVIAWMQRSRALVLPTRGEEAFGLVVVEAMACGLPVALSDVALIRDYVGQVGTEWIYAAATPGETERVLGLIADDQAVDMAGRRARNVYLDKFADDGAQSLVSVYEDALSHREALH